MLLEIIKSSLTNLKKSFNEELQIFAVDHLNESVFRHLFIREIIKSNIQVGINIECDRIDLVCRFNGEVALIEFKYYLHARKFDVITGNKIGLKGYPSSRNWNEFVKCVNDLHEYNAGSSKVIKIIILFYSDPEKPEGRKYAKNYKEFDSTFLEKYKLNEMDKDYEFGVCDKTKSKFTCKLFSIDTVEQGITLKQKVEEMPEIPNKNIVQDFERNEEYPNLTASPLYGKKLTPNPAMGPFRGNRAITVNASIGGKEYAEVVKFLAKNMKPIGGARAERGGGYWYAMDMVRTAVRLKHIIAN